jgi:hypothetical protein
MNQNMIKLYYSKLFYKFKISKTSNKKKVKKK